MSQRIWTSAGLDPARFGSPLADLDLLLKTGSHVRFLALALGLMLASLRRTCEPALTGLSESKKNTRNKKHKQLRIRTESLFELENLSWPRA